MSLAQFRPEKNHKCQINTMKKIVDTLCTFLFKIKKKKKVTLRLNFTFVEQQEAQMMKKSSSNLKT